jgi:hypothetical protein
LTTTAIKSKDAVVSTLVSQIVAGIDEIAKGNEVLLADESGTPVREIDKVLKDKDSDIPEHVRALWNEAQEAYKKYRESVEAARNGFRTEVLGEDAKAASTLSDEEKESLKETRGLVMGSLGFLETYANGNNLGDVLEWVKSVSVPQVGRQGSSTVGAKKPRVFVKNGETVYGSFTEAAAGLSSKDNKVTAADLAQAWNDAGGVEGDIQFGDHVLNVTFKPKKSDA